MLWSFAAMFIILPMWFICVVCYRANMLQLCVTVVGNLHCQYVLNAPIILPGLLFGHCVLFGLLTVELLCSSYLLLL